MSNESTERLSGPTGGSTPGRGEAHSSGAAELALSDSIKSNNTGADSSSGQRSIFDNDLSELYGPSTQLDFGSSGESRLDNSASSTGARGEIVTGRGNQASALIAELPSIEFIDSEIPSTDTEQIDIASDRQADINLQTSISGYATAVFGEMRGDMASPDIQDADFASSSAGLHVGPMANRSDSTADARTSSGGSQFKASPSIYESPERPGSPLSKSETNKFENSESVDEKALDELIAGSEFSLDNGDEEFEDAENSKQAVKAALDRVDNDERISEHLLNFLSRVKKN